MAPIVANPEDARPLADSATALRELAAQPSTSVALISGRALGDLARLSGMSDAVHLVGSHGSEFDTGFVHDIDEPARALLQRITDALAAIAAEHPGVTVETKPASVALHVRNADPADGTRRSTRPPTAARSWDAQVTDGKAVQGIRGDPHRQGAGASKYSASRRTRPQWCSSVTTSPTRRHSDGYADLTSASRWVRARRWRVTASTRRTT